MSQDQVNQLLGKLQTLETTVDALKNEIGGHLSALEFRVYQLEGHAATTSGSSVVHAPYQTFPAIMAPGGPNPSPAPSHGFQNPQQAARDPRGPPHGYHAPWAPGSSRNASHLPFAIEAIAQKHQNQRHSGGAGW